MSLSATLIAQIRADYASVLDLSDVTDRLNYKQSIALASGTGADQADLIFHDQRTIAASGNEDLDLAGVLIDSFGSTLTLARLKALLIAASSSNANNCNVTSPGTNGVPGLFLALGDGIVVRPGGAFAWFAPDATGAVVTAATGDLLNVANSGAGSAVTYDVVIIGASA